MKRRWFFLLWIVLVAGSVNGADQSKPLKKRIRRADQRMYRAVQYATAWKNPFLVVWPGGIEIDGTAPNHEVIKVELVGEVLNALPDSAWPMGLVVAVQNAGFAESDRNGVNQTRQRLIATLEKMEIAVDLWP